MPLCVWTGWRLLIWPYERVSLTFGYSKKVKCSLIIITKKIKGCNLSPSVHYMYRTAVTICTTQRSIHVPHSGHYMYRTAVTICIAQWSLYVPHSGYYMYHTAVTICTAQWSLYVPHNDQYLPPVWHSTILRSAHTAVFMCFVWISEQTAIISLYSINWLVFITETESVYCAVRTEYLNVIRFKCHPLSPPWCPSPPWTLTVSSSCPHVAQDYTDVLVVSFRPACNARVASTFS